MRFTFLFLLTALLLLSCKNTEDTSTIVLENDSVAVKAPFDFVGEYFNPANNETAPNGMRIRLRIRKDSLEGLYLLDFTTVASNGKDSCSLNTRALLQQDTLFTHITNGTDTARLYIAFLPQKQKRTLDVFTTRFRNKAMLTNFCKGNASIAGSYELADKPSSAFDTSQQQLGFLRSFVHKKASEVRLFNFEVVKERLSTLLGAEEFKALESNWIIENSFEHRQGDIFLVSACKTAGCNVYKTNIFFDIPNDNITVMITKKGESSIFTEKSSLQLPESLLQEIERTDKD